MADECAFMSTEGANLEIDFLNVMKTVKELGTLPL